MNKLINPLDLTGRNILVTGASSGIGRETAILLSQLGARVVLVARREDELIKTKNLMQENDHLVAPFDLTDFEGSSSWMKNVAAKTGGLHGLVHSAGIQITQPIRFSKIEDVNSVFSTNVYSAIFLAKAFRQAGVREAGSSIVFLSSVVGLVGAAGIAAYSASKGALVSLAKTIAIEFVRDGIRVNCVAPAYVQTEMLNEWSSNLTDEQKAKNIEDSSLGVGTSRDVANAIAFLLSGAARWITGTTLVVDGGYTAR